MSSYYNNENSDLETRKKLSKWSQETTHEISHKVAVGLLSLPEINLYKIVFHPCRKNKNVAIISVYYERITVCAIQDNVGLQTTTDTWLFTVRYVRQA